MSVGSMAETDMDMVYLELVLEEVVLVGELAVETEDLLFFFREGL